MTAPGSRKKNHGFLMVAVTGIRLADPRIPCTISLPASQKVQQLLATSTQHDDSPQLLVFSSQHVAPTTGPPRAMSVSITATPRISFDTTFAEEMGDRASR